MSEFASDTGPPESWDPAIVELLKKRYECPNFRILVVGRANAGKTTILEKVCGVQHGTTPIIREAPAPKSTKSLLHRILNRPKGTSNSMSSSSTECLKPSIYVSGMLKSMSFKLNAAQTSSEGSTILKTRLRMKGATSSSMIPVALKQEQLRRW
jgi:septin family protein